MLVRPEYLVQLHREGRVWPRRQEAEREPGALYRPPKKEYFRFIAISHAWESREHPDPCGFQLEQIVRRIKWQEDFPNFLDWERWWGVYPVFFFIDFLSLYQYKRDQPGEEEDQEKVPFFGTAWVMYVGCLRKHACSSLAVQQQTPLYCPWRSRRSFPTCDDGHAPMLRQLGLRVLLGRMADRALDTSILPAAADQAGQNSVSLSRGHWPGGRGRHRRPGAQRHALSTAWLVLRGGGVEQAQVDRHRSARRPLSALGPGMVGSSQPSSTTLLVSHMYDLLESLPTCLDGASHAECLPRASHRLAIHPPVRHGTCTPLAEAARLLASMHLQKLSFMYSNK